MEKLAGDVREGEGGDRGGGCGECGGAQDGARADLFRQALALISERVTQLTASRGMGVAQGRAAFEPGDEELPVIVPAGGAAAAMSSEDMGLKRYGHVPAWRA